MKQEFLELSKKITLHLQTREENNLRRKLSYPNFRRAAVLVPILFSNTEEPQLLFTVRSQTLSNHGGQISFPGGKLDHGENVFDAALRECEEEIGLQSQHINILGLLNDVWSPSKYETTPVLALVDASATLHANESEVSQILKVPIKELLQLPKRFEWRTPKATKPPELPPELLQPRQVLHYDWNDYDIWGMTAWITEEVLEFMAQHVEENRWVNF